MLVDIEGIKRAVANGRYRWRLHALVRMAERGILQQDALDVIAYGECVEQHSEDTPLPSAIFLGTQSNGHPLHVVVSCSQMETTCYILKLTGFFRRPSGASRVL